MASPYNIGDRVLVCCTKFPGLDVLGSATVIQTTDSAAEVEISYRLLFWSRTKRFWLLNEYIFGKISDRQLLAEYREDGYGSR